MNAARLKAVSAATMFLVFASCAHAGEFSEAVFGNTATAASLLRYDAIDSVDDLQRLARIPSLEQGAGLYFPFGNPLGTRLGEVQFNRGLPLYYTTQAGRRSGLYRWTSNEANFFDTADLSAPGPRPGIRSLNVFGYEAPTCVGIRGNGPRLWAHFSSLARIVEQFGLIGGAAGGSSGSISVFVTESVHANPLLTDCGGRVCERTESIARMALLFKSIEGLQSAGLIDDVLAATQLVNLILAGDIQGLLDSEDPFEGVQALIDILQDPDLQQIINPEILELLLTSPDPVFHATDIVQGLQLALSFQVTDPLPLVRPGPINFDAFANIVGRLGDFLAGYGNYDAKLGEAFMQSCAVPGLDLDWPTVSQLPAAGGTCGTLFTDFFDGYLAQYDPDTQATRLDDPIGLYLRALVTTSVLENDAVETFEQARASYLAAQPVAFDIDFADVGFGYWGRGDDLARTAQAIGQFGDAKSAKFRSLGTAVWRDILSVSPAEPGLSRALELPDGRISAGGWSDPVPTQVLLAAGCDRVVLVNRRDGIGGFTTGVAGQLGASQADLDGLYDLGDPGSGFSTSLSEASGVWCTDWDAPDSFDIAGLAAEGWNAPLETADPELLGYVNAGTGLGLPGCTPGVQ